MNNGEVTPTSQYVLSYNNNDFYSNNKTLVDNLFLKKNTDLRTNCEKNSPYKTGNTKRDDVLNELCKNNKNYSKLKEIQTTHYASSGRYNDTTQYHNTEMIKSVNLGIGIIGLSLIIYTLY